MAEKLRTFDFEKPSELTSSEKIQYPWDQWLDGDIWQLTQGEDFMTHPLMMERIIRTRATTRQAKVRLRHQPLHEGNGDPFGMIVIQRTDKVGPADAKKAEQKAKRDAKKAQAAAEAEQFIASTGAKAVKPTTKTVAVKGGSKRPARTDKRQVSKRPVRKSVAA